MKPRWPLVGLAFFLLSACNSAEPDRDQGAVSGVAGAPAPNLVIVLADTLRADRTSLYGYGRETTPYLQRLARRGITFESAYSPSPCTFPAVNSLLTGRDPSQFLLGAESYLGLPETLPTLQGVLSSRGWQTVAVSASPIVTAEPTDLNPDGGFGVGFERFDAQCLWRRGACMNRRVRFHLEHLDERPFFFYLHFMDTHDPYRPTPEHLRTFYEPDVPNDDLASVPDMGTIMSRFYESGAPPSAEELTGLVDLYDDEVRFLDFQIERLVAQLEDAGALENTWLLIVSDHGEEHFEHGDLGHCRSTHETQIHVPLLLVPPLDSDYSVGRRSRATVSLVDVMGTMVDLMTGQEAPGLDGRSFSEVVRDEEVVVDQRWAVSRQGRWSAAVQGRNKLLVDPERRVRFFDLATDPAEVGDHSLEADEVGLLKRLLREHARRYWRVGDPESGNRRLESLGYL